MILSAADDAQNGISIELTPMIDMVFLLLIFFLIATTIRQTERELSIALPSAETAEPISVALREMIINIDAEGRVGVGGRSLDAGQLRRLIEDAVTANPQQKVTVRGDRRTAYDHVVRVLDVCKGAGVAQPYLDTVLR